MIVTFISQCEKKSLNKTRRVLDAFANRIGSRAWQTPITSEGLLAVKTLLSKTATKNTAVACHKIKSRKLTKLEWIVGNRDKFNFEGHVPVNYTNKKESQMNNDSDWQFLAIIESLTVFSALMHDFGKLTVLFQNKLKGKNKILKDPLRHEWVSLLFLIAIVDNKTDEEWLTCLISNEIHEKIMKLKVINVKNPLSNLPPVASIIAWLIVSHHKLPKLDKKKYAGKHIVKQDLFNLISQNWGYADIDSDKDFKDWFKYMELPSKSIEWQQEIKKYAIELKCRIREIEGIYQSQAIRPILAYTRLCLMLGDHYYSSQGKDKNWHSDIELYANTDNNKQLKQKLDEHLVGVAKQAKVNTRKLPRFEGVFNQEIRVLKNKKIKIKSKGVYKWQDKAVDNIKSWKKKNSSLDKNQYGFFAVNMASTGKGKTFANAKIMQVLSANEESLRYILALGLRTLTLQTGDEYRDKVGLKNNELAILIGSRAILELHNKNKTGSESDNSLLDNELRFNHDFPEQGLDTVLKSMKDRQFLYAPVLTCTIDHIIQATEVIRGGRYILPTLRLMSSDIVIDEIDDFDNTDLIAIGRLIHLAGMLGRKVMISSATIPPDMSEGYFNAYQAGWAIFAQMRNKNPSIGCAWIDEFKTKANTIIDKQEYKQYHDKFIEKRLKKLNEQPAKRKVNIVKCSTKLDEYFDTVKKEIHLKHKHHHFIDKKTGKTISIGVVRMANVKPCIEMTRHLLGQVMDNNTEIKAMAYHSRQVLLMRHEQEKYLDKILKRKSGNQHILEDETIRKHIDSSNAGHITFVLVATPVEEVGRDHDFDWAIIEPSSYRSFIQLAGRVLRHREQEVLKPNIAIMQYNYRALKGSFKKVAFKWPGYQQNIDDITSYDLEKLIDSKELANNIDATNRIKKTKSSELANLEHKAIHEMLTNYEIKGPDTMQGWIESDWWLTALPQQYIKFRNNSNTDKTLYMTLDNVFLEKDNKGYAIQEGKDNIEFYCLSAKEVNNIWLIRDYESALREIAGNDEVKKNALIYGEINLPYGRPLTTQKYKYNEQLGLVSK